MPSNVLHLVTAMHCGWIRPQAIIAFLQDRHRARLPEVGLDAEWILRQAKAAHVRNCWCSCLQFIPLLCLWSVVILLVGTMLGLAPFRPADLSPPLLVLLLSIPLAGVVAITYIKEVAIIRHLRNRVLGCEPAPAIAGEENVVVFGGSRPFAGHGSDLGGWSFAVDLLQAKAAGTPPQPVQLSEVLAAVTEGVTTAIAAADWRDVLFANGALIRERGFLLATPTAQPAARVPEQTVATYLGSLDPAIRHYRRFVLPFSEGRMHLSIMFRVTKVGESLFLECRNLVLNPIPDFCDVDAMVARRGVGWHLACLTRLILVAPVSMLGGAWFAVKHVSAQLERLKRSLRGDPEDERKRSSSYYNYGRQRSLREIYSSCGDPTYFQRTDLDMVAKISAHAIVDALVGFLDRKGIATDEIKERSTVIFNSGVMVSGGTFRADQVAVGQGATVRSRVGGAAAAVAKA